MQINSFSIGQPDDFGQENFNLNLILKNENIHTLTGMVAKISISDEKNFILESRNFSVFGKNLEDDVGIIIENMETGGEFCLDLNESYVIDLSIPVLPPDSSWGSGRTCRIDAALYARELYNLGDIQLPLIANEQSSLVTRIATDIIDPDIRALVSCRQEDEDSERRILVNCGISNLGLEKLRVELGYTLIGNDGLPLVDDDGEVCGGVEGVFLDRDGDTVLRHDWWLDHMIEKLAPRNVSRMRLTLAIYRAVTILSSERTHIPA